MATSSAKASADSKRALSALSTSTDVSLLGAATRAIDLKLLDDGLDDVPIHAAERSFCWPAAEVTCDLVSMVAEFAAEGFQGGERTVEKAARLLQHTGYA
jgi:hypothetical protein